MADEPPIICNQCGYILGPKEEEVLDPGNNEPADPHFKVQQRDDGEERLQCMDTGRLASPIGHEDDDYAELFHETHGSLPEEVESPSEPEETVENHERVGEESRRSRSDDDSVFDFEEDKDQMQLLAEVVSNPHYDLSDEQIMEVKEWAKDYNGQMPPDALESLVANMSGVQKQTAKLIRKRYELKLNNWFRQQQSEDSRGPPIGAMGGVGAMQRSSGAPSPRTTPTPNVDRTEEKPKTDEEEEVVTRREEEDSREVGGLPNQDLRKERRQRRVKRRNDALDITAEEMAKEAAPEIARELTRNFGTYFGLPAKIIEAKAEQDPDWFIEKADEFEEKLGISIFDILEDSQTKKEREEREGGRRRRRQTRVDDEMDQALERVTQEDDKEETEGGKVEEDNERSTMNEKETVNTTERLRADGNNMITEESEEFLEEQTQDAEEEDEPSRDEMFDKIFGESGGEQ